METLRLLLQRYETFDPAAWVGAWTQLAPWVGGVLALLGIAFLVQGGGALFRLVAGPLGALVGLNWTWDVLGVLGLASGSDPRLAQAVALVLAGVGFLFPTALLAVAVGVPVGLLGAHLGRAGYARWGLGLGFALGAGATLLLRRPARALVAGCVGAWLLVLGALAGLSPYTQHVKTVAAYPWVLLVGALVLGAAAAYLQVAHARRRRERPAPAPRRSLHEPVMPTPPPPAPPPPSRSATTPEAKELEARWASYEAKR